jgi:hypothetical protein
VYASIPLLALSLALPGTSPKDGRELIRAMHDRYAGAWYRTLAFTQHNTATDTAGKETTSTWKEYATFPGNLRIDFLPSDSGGGVVFRSDTEYVFAHDTLARTIPLIHSLLVLGFDVYVQPVDTTLAKLTRLGVDLATMHEDTWQGRPVYVVGAAAGDSTHTQFWVDRERLVFVRMLQPAGRPGTTRMADSRFEDYRPVGGAWLSARVVFLVGGRPVWKEEYVDIRTDQPLDAALFDPRRFAGARPGT